MTFNILQPDWPPADLAAYYKSESFLRQLKILQTRLERAYPNADAESIVYDSAADVLMKEIGDHDIYNSFMVRYETEGHFLHYLYASCCNKVIDHARSFQRKSRQLLEEENVEDNRLGPVDTVIGSEERKQSIELAKELEITVISKLPKLDRLILKHRLSDKTFSEIAELLDISGSTVHRRYKSIIARLVSQLEGRVESKKAKPMP